MHTTERMFATSLAIFLFALVIFMLPTVRAFYGGSGRRGNLASTLGPGVGAAVLVFVQWTLLGLGRASADGGLECPHALVFLDGCSTGGHSPDLSVLYLAFQSSFVILVPALISRKLIDRQGKQSWLLAFPILATALYAPAADFLGLSGRLDFAVGSGVLLGAGGVCVTLMVRRERAGGRTWEAASSDWTATVLGAAFLWFGWFAFNGGSGLASPTIALDALTNSTLATVAGVIVWAGPAKSVVARCGSGGVAGPAVFGLAGLIGVTPAAGFVSPMSAIGVGAVSATVCMLVQGYVTKEG